MELLRALEHRIPPPVVGALVAAAMWLVAGYGPQLPLPAAARYATVAVFAVAGIAFDVFGIAAFRSARTTVNPLKPERASSVVTGGVYRVSRNPMYLGLALLLIAWAVYLGAAWPLAGPVVYVAVITRLQIVPEERVLRAMFGEAYGAYAARVRRWL
jgi:protein-S-isoprenylcysteine O-methyltransferase Ste14